MALFSDNEPALKLGAILDQKVPAVAGGTIMVPAFETEQGFFSATSTSQTIYVCDNLSGTFKIVAVASRFGTASSSGTLQVEVAGAGVAVGSGTNQLTGTISLAGTTNTTTNGTIIASPTTISTGSAINVILAGTLTSLANHTVNIILQRIS